MAMKIAFIVDEFPSMTQVGVLNQATGLLDLGHDLHIFASRVATTPSVHADIETYRLADRLTSFDVPLKESKRVLSGLGIAAREFRSRPREVVESLNVFKYGRPASSTSLIHSLPKRPADEFDIIHGHFGPNAIVGQFWKALGTGGRLIASFHGVDVSRYPRRAGANVYAGLFEAADVITGNTEFLKRKLVDLGCDPMKIAVIPSAIRLERFEVPERKSRPAGPARILTIGRLVEKKGHEYALRALGRISSRFGFEYTIAGDGPLKDDLLRLTNQLGLQERVIFLGGITQEKAAKLYRESDLFLLPSVTSRELDHEGQALVIQEAEAARLPVVSTFHNGIPEGVIDGVSALLVAERDDEALSNALARLLEHPELWGPMGDEGHKIASTRYDVPVVTARLVEIYESAAGKQVEKVT